MMKLKVDVAILDGEGRVERCEGGEKEERARVVYTTIFAYIYTLVLSQARRRLG